jgi:G3E family GTPase
MEGLMQLVNYCQFGEVDIDGSLVAAQKTGVEDIMMLNNGCLCCTVRGDLVEMIEELVTTKKDLFDHILIETTGMFRVSWFKFSYSWFAIHVLLSATNS